MRSRKAAAAQARRFSRSAAPFLYQSPRMRGLRRLFGAVELHRRPAARDAGRTQATYRPVCVQQGLFVRERILSELRRTGSRRTSQTGGRSYPRGGSRPPRVVARRSEAHTSELQSLMRTSYAVFWLKK